MLSAILGRDYATLAVRQANVIALMLRIGLGAVFIIGGWWKLSRALDPMRASDLVAQYTADDGYINVFFMEYLFGNGLIAPLDFLILLSSFELISGLLLVFGLFVRSLSFIHAFLLWTFVLALPVTTMAGAGAYAPGHYSPAMLVQIRDIGMSGMFFVLFNLGSGVRSIDRSLLGRGFASSSLSWNALGLLLRLSVAAVFLVGGFFFGFDHIKSYVPIPVLLIAIGAMIACGHLVRPAALAGAAVILFYSATQIGFDVPLWDNFNAIKREIAFLAALAVLGLLGGGASFRPKNLLKAPSSSLLGADRNVASGRSTEKVPGNSA